MSSTVRSKPVSARRFALAAIGLSWLHLALVTPSVNAGSLKLVDMCRLKGQEINTLQGLGLVVGLRGTGDPDSAPTARALAQMMKNMGAPMALDSTGALNLKDVDDARNVAMVFVTARVPAVGAQPGDLLDVTINAIGAKSLEGGTLMLTPLLGPRADNPTVYAMAQGQLNVSLDGPATTATIQGGAKMEATVRASFSLNGKITLVIDRDFASFETALRIEDEINSFSELASFGQASNLGSQSVRALRSCDRSSPRRGSNTRKLPTKSDQVHRPPIGHFHSTFQPFVTGRDQRT